jgi:hypothetical protein
MSTTVELSIEIMTHIQRMLNNQIENHGEIKINNKTIWNGFLHQMDNHVWRGCLETLEELSQQHPALFDHYHLNAIESGLKALDKYEQYYDRVLDMRNRHLDHKKIAWRCIMTIREVMNRAQNITLKNSDEAQVKTSFGSLFE